jgi:hypothetical protein
VNRQTSILNAADRISNLIKKRFTSSIFLKSLPEVFTFLPSFIKPKHHLQMQVVKNL